MLPSAEAERRRKAIEAILAKERTQVDVAKEFGVSRQAINQWVKRYQADSGKVVGTGRRISARLNEAVKAELQEIVESKAPSDFAIESEDDRWHWIELHDLLFERTRRRFPRRDCMKLLEGWGVPDPDISKERKAALRHHHDHAPVSTEESNEFMQLLAAARARMEQEKARAREAAKPKARPKDDKQRAKRIERQRRKQKLAQKHKRKQRRKNKR